MFCLLLFTRYLNVNQIGNYSICQTLVFILLRPKCISEMGDYLFVLFTVCSESESVFTVIKLDNYFSEGGGYILVTLQ